MSTIKKINIKNFIGIEELGIDPAKINIFKGPKGSCKSSILEAIEKTFTNNNRRTEVIRHGTGEATLFVELTDGLTIDRKIRAEKADYLKCRRENEFVPSTEKFLKGLINGEVFRPLDWVNMGIKEQTKSILSMVDIDWSKDDIVNWFGELTSNIDYDQHILQIIKAIELKYYKDREEVNRGIKELTTQIDVILKELPAEYDGEEWRNYSLQELYGKVTEAQKTNHWIEEAKRLLEHFDDRKNSILLFGEAEKSKIKLRYKAMNEDIQDIITIQNAKIDRAKEILNNIGEEEETSKETLTREMEREIAEVKSKYAALQIEEIKRIRAKEDEQKELICLYQSKTAGKIEELKSLKALEEQELLTLEEKVKGEVQQEEENLEKAKDFLSYNKIQDVSSLQQKADNVAKMQSYLRQWDMMIEIRDGKLSEKQRYAALLGSRIDKARAIPIELIKTAKMPVEGITVDTEGRIRINNTLIDGLSDGEKLELAMKIARGQAGELKVICLDRFESLNPKAQQNLLEEISKDEFQYFITSTTADEFNVEKLN